MLTTIKTDCLHYMIWCHSCMLRKRLTDDKFN
jgi:hypothetical protein